MMRPRWIDPIAVPADLPTLDDDPLVHDLLARRGVRTTAHAADFLGTRRRHVPDPSGLPNLQAAVDRIGQAIERRERIGVFGDYDADGVTSTALLTRGLRSATGEPDLVIPRLPTREEGYGLNRAAISELHSAGVRLLIAVDCGSGDHDQVAFARELGIEVIAFDHHQLPAGPASDAIVVSAQLPGGAAFTDLCAAGVAYMAVSCLARDGYQVGGAAGNPETDLLQFVALGTIADMVPVSGINRSLIRDGLAVMCERPCPGLRALCKRAGVTLSPSIGEQVAYKIGPRLNAAGRMGDPGVALDLLLEEDTARAEMLALELETLNDRRRMASTKVLREAETMVALDPELAQRPLIVVHGKVWPSGLLGPVAAQLVERYRRPAVVLTGEGGHVHGSVRSVPGLDIMAAIEHVQTLLTRFGGHHQAAGVALHPKDLQPFTEALGRAIGESGVDLPFTAELRIDADLPIDRVTMATVESVGRMQPFGMGNEQPLFRLRNVQMRQYDVIGTDRSHLRLQLGVPGGTLKAVMFGAAERSRELVTARRIDVVGLLKTDTWNGQRRLDFEVKDFEAVG